MEKRRLTCASTWRSMPEPEKWLQELRLIAREREKAGRRVIALYEGDVVVHGHINEQASEFLVQAEREGWSMYPDVTTWADELKKAIAEFEKVYRKVDYLPDNIVLAPGVAGCYNVLHSVLLEPGDEVIVVEPAHYYWHPAKTLFRFGAKVVTSRSIEENEWEPDIDDLRAKITDRTKAIVIDHPNNPTGAIYSDKALKAIADIAGEYDLLIVSDEIYGMVTFDGVEAKSMARIAGDVPVAVLNSTSKLFQKPGWRIGYIAFHDPAGKIAELIKVANRVATMYDGLSRCIPTPILVAATRLFRWYSLYGLKPEYRDLFSVAVSKEREFVRRVQRCRDLAWKLLNEIEGVRCVKPRGSLYAFPRVDAIGKVWRSDEEFVLQLAREEGILVVPGCEFGPSGAKHFRTTIMASPEVIEEAFTRLGEFIARHTKGR